MFCTPRVRFYNVPMMCKESTFCGNKTPCEQRDLMAADLWEALCNGEHDLMPDEGVDSSSWREQAQRQRAAMYARAHAGDVR